MVDHCAACPEPFRYMRGRIYQFRDQFGDHKHVEHFWLCEQCAEHFDLRYGRDGQVHVVPRERAA